MKLPLIPQDKANHIIYGLVIFLLSNLFLNNYFSFVVAFTFALGKEIYDEYKYSGFDYKDLIATILFPILLILLYLFK
jgi:hypothetical protein